MHAPSRIARRAWLQVMVAALLLSVGFGTARAMDPRPESIPARWSGEVWGRVRAVPGIARYGDKIHLHGVVIGGPAADPWWSCSQYSGWAANGTNEIVLVVPGAWQMPGVGLDYFGNFVNIMTRDAGEMPPYGYANRLSETCYCEVTTFGAQGGCPSREHQPMFFHMMDPMNPREGNVQFATVTSGRGWTTVKARFSGRAGVNWTDTANDAVYVVSEDVPLEEDLDGDGLADAWELAHSPNRNLDDFSGTEPAPRSTVPRAATVWADPYAPKEPAWVPTMTGDWDGDGVSDRKEYQLWKARTTDGDGIPYDPTYINAPRRAADDGGCGAAGTRGSLAGLVAVGLLALVRAGWAAGSRRTRRAVGACAY